MHPFMAVFGPLGVVTHVSDRFWTDFLQCCIFGPFLCSHHILVFILVSGVALILLAYLHPALVVTSLFCGFPSSL